MLTLIPAMLEHVTPLTVNWVSLMRLMVRVVVLLPKVPAGEKVPPVDVVTAETLQARDDVEVLTTGPSTFLTFNMWVDTEPFDDVRVRQALKLVVDRTQIIDVALSGFGSAGDDNPIPPGHPYAWRSDAQAQDVEEARSLLAAAGYDEQNPLEVDLYSADVLPGMTSAVQLYAQMAAEAGIQVNVITTPASEYWDNVWMKQPFQVSFWTVRPPSEGLAVSFRSEAESNETHWRREAYDALLDEAAATADPDDRAELYSRAARMLSEEGGAIIPAFVDGVAAVRAECEGYEPRAEITRTDFRTVACDG